MKNSKIAWTDHTFNPWWGCVKVSQGCKHCYAETFANRTGHNVWGVDAPRRFFGDKYWSKPLKWNKEAEESGERKKVFVASMADVFEKHRNPEINNQMANERVKLFELVKVTPMLDWLLLTKRPENIFSLGTDAVGYIFDLYLADYTNVWLGVSAENQEQLDIRMPSFSRVFPSVRFLSVEPMLEPISLYEYIYGPPRNRWWVIVGGESGPGCRPFNWDWARDVRDQCAQAGIPFFMKQGGGHPNKRDQMEDFPEDLRIREFPE